MPSLSDWPKLELLPLAMDKVPLSTGFNWYRFLNAAIVPLHNPAEAACLSSTDDIMVGHAAQLVLAARPSWPDREACAGWWPLFITQTSG